MLLVMAAGKEIVAQAKLILTGKAIIGADVTPRHMMETGSWSRMTYTLNENEFPEIHDEASLTKEVRSPIVIIDGKVSSILSNLEAQARKLCK